MKLAIALSTALLLSAAARAQTATADQLTPGEKRFLEQAAQINMTEAHLGRMAREKSSNQAVKDFGGTLEQDHTQSYQQLSSLADQFRFDIPKSIDQQHQRTIQQFQNLSGRQFDQKFILHQTQGHREALALFQREKRSAQDLRVQAYAREMVSVLQRHGQAAQNLSQQGGSTAAAAPASQNGAGPAGLANGGSHQQNDS